VLIALAPEARQQLRGGVAVLGAAALAGLVASRLPTVESLAIRQQGDAGEGLLMLAALVLLALAAGAVVIRERRPARREPSLRISRPAAVLTLSVVALLIGAIAYTALEGRPQGVSPERTVGAERLGSVDSNRYRYWRVALESWADRPLIGLGSGGFRVAWLKERDRVDQSADAHSLYIETAAELGLVGIALLLLFLGGIAACALRLYRLDAAAAAGPAAALAAWAVHAGLDWDWEMPALTLMALLLGAAAVAWSEEPRPLVEESSVERRALQSEDGHPRVLPPMTTR
jgi:O-antigen ligase